MLIFFSCNNWGFCLNIVGSNFIDKHVRAEACSWSFYELNLPLRNIGEIRLGFVQVYAIVQALHLIPPKHSCYSHQYIPWGQYKMLYSKKSRQEKASSVNSSVLKIGIIHAMQVSKQGQKTKRGKCFISKMQAAQRQVRIKQQSSPHTRTCNQHLFRMGKSKA